MACADCKLMDCPTARLPAHFGAIDCAKRAVIFMQKLPGLSLSLGLAWALSRLTRVKVYDS